MSSLPDRQTVSRRRARRPVVAGSHGVPDATAREPFRWAPIVTLVAVLAVVVAAGIGMQYALAPAPPSGLSKCALPARTGPSTFAKAPAMCIDTKKTYIATLQTTKGSFQIVMAGADAPQTINNFVVLALNGYFNGRRFFLTQSWVVQTGDPNDDGTGGPGYTLPEEKNAQPWVQGAVGMARFSNTISGSQFFILKSTWPGNGPGDTTFNHFGTVLGGTQLVGTLDATDRIIGVSLSTQ